MTAVESFIGHKAATGMQCGSYSIDLPPLKPGQQYRFHFDATKCIGCRCCEVACNEQNDNPAHVKWRRVGEAEGGEFPHTLQLFLSMSCNHCVDPACLRGCPADAYIKLENGVVFHDDPACIGCQYCTWNCPYDVPVYHPERRIVTKCHMCYERLEAGQTPACVQACPEGAIEIEAVDLDEWVAKDMAQKGRAPGLIDPAYTKPTTRFTLPESLPELTPADADLVRPEHKELPLVAMTLLTQASVAGLIALLLLDLLSRFTPLPSPHPVMAAAIFALAALGLPLSALHLGRPALAHRAFKNLRTSWLSREAAALGLYAALAGLVALLFYTQSQARIVAELLAAAVGIYGIYAQSMIYRVPAKPTWNTPLTTYTFFASGYMGLQLLALIAILTHQTGYAHILLALAILLGGAQLYLFFENLRRYENPPAEFAYQFERSKKLLDEHFASLHRLRKATLPLAAIILPLLAVIALSAGSEGFAFVFTLSGLGLGAVSEWVGRTLFYATATKTGMPGHFFAGSQRGM